MLDILYRVIAELLTKAFDKLLASPLHGEPELISELKKGFQDLSYPQDKDGASSEIVWTRNMDRLRELVLNDDPRRFLRWDVVRSSMFIEHPRYIQKELNSLRKQPDWKARWREAIKESNQGHPRPYPFYPSSSGNLIHHAYHLLQFERRMQMPVQEMECILEFGGGYGSLCRLLHRLGFKGNYITFDLPPFSMLQLYFLKSVGIQAQESSALSSMPSSVICISNPADLKTVLAERFRKNKSLFISTWAISETPMHIRQSFLPFINMFDFYLIAYQHRFEEMDNIRYFTDWRKQFDNQVLWQNWEIEHLPGNSYLMGKRLMPIASC